MLIIKKLIILNHDFFLLNLHLFVLITPYNYFELVPKLGHINGLFIDLIIFLCYYYPLISSQFLYIL